ncbi:MAG: LuxR C-terminal-related transcriptional regulator [Prolixibacteraceae bacterium]|nr:LuxR C-terminal-related transcriptional regulator [Prolixibacteraceae bacterium]
MHKKLIYILIYILSLNPVFADIINIGVPYIHNYPRKEYKGGTQNWAITQDQRGFMYFANNNGLLQFDGVTWQTHLMPNLSIVRSVYLARNGGIYVGAYNDLGKLVVGKNGKMEFRSLKKYLPSEYLNFDDIWNITEFEDKIVYQSYNCAFQFNNDSVVSVIKAPTRFQNSYSINGRLYFNDIEKGLLEFTSNKLLELEDCESLKGEEIWSILPFKDRHELLIFTLNKGIFIYNGKELKEWSVPVNALLKKNQIFSAISIHDNYFAVGTIQDGLIIIDDRGNIIQHINRSKGLQNNTILRVFSDQDGNLWLGLDNGIDFVNINSPITFLQQSDGIGAGYTALIHKGKIYLGTNQGLFVKNWGSENKDNEFRLVPGTNGQVWYLGVHDDILLCGHNNGTFEIDGEKAISISKIPGAWKFHMLKRFPEYLIGGTYSGLTIYAKQKGKWVLMGNLKGFTESFRVFEEDENGNLWMSHGFKGIYKIQIGNQLDSIRSSRFYTEKDGLPTNYNLNVYKIKGKIIITSNAGVYEYNAENDRFESSEYFNQLFSPLKDISYLKEDKNGNIWYVAWDLAKNKAGVFRIQEDLTYKHVTAPFGLLTGKFISGFESVYFYSEDHILFGTEDGFAHYSQLTRFNHNPAFLTFINRATALYLDSTFSFGNIAIAQNAKLKSSPNEIEHLNFSFPFKDNSFRFSYTSPSYDNQDNIEYSFKLSGYNNKWSEWSTTPFNEYANLPPGDYIFNVKARNQLGIESSTDVLYFSIRPPWYKSNYAYIAYLLIFIAIIILSIWIILKRIEISKRKERLKHLRSYRQKEQEYIRQALLSEKKIINLKNEKLKIEMIHRDKELANQTMDLIRKNKFLVKIKEELEKLKKSSNDDALKDKITSLITKIDKDIDHKKQWEIFETAFDEVHEDFLSRLKEQYPNLTPKELKLCAYLRMNISTKEIAPLMNISIRGVEICRYRVRKKLNIDRDQNLTRMIIDL